MGNRLTENESQQKTGPNYGDIFDELLPHYILMGMTPEQFWDGESANYPAYRKAYQLKLETDQKLADRQNWYMGQYILMALNTTPLLVAGLNVKKGVQLPEYPDKPFLEKLEEQKKEENRRKQEEDQQKLAMALFQAGIAKFNKQFQKRKEREERAKAVGTGQ